VVPVLRRQKHRRASALAFFSQCIAAKSGRIAALRHLVLSVCIGVHLWLLFFAFKFIGAHRRASAVAFFLHCIGFAILQR
jgi:hypothetical protein